MRLKYKYDSQILDASIWPICTAFSLFNLLTGAAIYIIFKESITMWLGLTTVIISINL